MRYFLTLLALTALLAGCAGQQDTGRADRDTLLDCRSQADEVNKARYTPAWDEAVRQCLEQHAND